jgi:hypothetical protein
VHRSLLLLAIALSACGTRTALELILPTDGGVAPGDAGVPPPCRGQPWLVFQLSSESGSNVYAMRADGSGGHILHLAKDGAFPSFSANGAKLLYVTIDAEAGDGGYLNTLVEQDLGTGATLELVTSLVQTDAEESSKALSYSAVSPDGTTVAYTIGYDVHLVNIDGTADRLLIQGSQNQGLIYGHPAFTADSQTVLYGALGNFGSIPVAGSNGPTILVTQDGTEGPQFPNPSPSPDGSSVASVISCAGFDAGVTETTLRTYPFASLPAPCASGTIVTTLRSYSSAYNSSANPAWGPSGLVAYGSGTDVWIADPSGGGLPRNMTAGLTRKTGAAFDPVWAPACAPIP